MSRSWHTDRLLRPQAGQTGQLEIVDNADGPAGRPVCVIPGHLVWQATPDTAVSLLDETDAENARLIVAAPELHAVLAPLVEWAAQMGGWEALPWQDAHALLARLRNPTGRG